MSEIKADVSKDKHIDMHEAIQGLSSITQHLGQLIDRMEGGPPAQEVISTVEKAQMPAFKDVWSGGPGAIRERTEEALKQIHDLTGMIF